MSKFMVSAMAEMATIFFFHLCIGCFAGVAFGLSPALPPIDSLRTLGDQLDQNDTCYTPECFRTASRILAYVNPKINPCENFYQFACGNFVKSAVLLAEEVGVNSAINVERKLQSDLREIVEADIGSGEPKHVVIVKNLYSSCMDGESIQARSMERVLKLLGELGGWPVLDEHWDEREFNWMSSVYKFHAAGCGTSQFVHTNVIRHWKDNTRYFIDLDQAIFDLDSKYLRKGLNDSLVQAYYEYMVEVAIILGASPKSVKAELLQSLEFEIQLAEISATVERQANFTKLLNPVMLKTLAANNTGIDWKQYLKGLFSPTVELRDEDTINVLSKKYLDDLDKLLAKTPKRVQANYAMWRVVAELIPYLDEEIRQTQLKYLQVVTGQLNYPPRWKECVEMVNSHLGLALGAMYATKYFSKNQKTDIAELMENIKNQLDKTLLQARWLDAHTKELARLKLKKMTSVISYPEELEDNDTLTEYYGELELVTDNYLKNMLVIKRFTNNRNFAKLRTAPTKNHWTFHEYTARPMATYQFLENNIAITAGILQGDFFNAERPKYMNYGAIGSVAGHEMSHGFDFQGSQFDENGNLNDWWLPTARAKFFERIECFVRQYGNYTDSELGIRLNGVRTKFENIADNVGIKTAYGAYVDSVARGNEKELKLPGVSYTPKQLFWLSAASTLCSKYRPEFLKVIIDIDVHTIEEYRLIGQVSNMPEFSEDFHCNVGDEMYPINRCSML